MADEVSHKHERALEDADKQGLLAAVVLAYLPGESSYGVVYLFPADEHPEPVISMLHSVYCLNPPWLCAKLGAGL